MSRLLIAAILALPLLAAMDIWRLGAEAARERDYLFAWAARILAFIAVWLVLFYILGA